MIAKKVTGCDCILCTSGSGETKAERFERGAIWPVFSMIGGEMKRHVAASDH